MGRTLVTGATGFVGAALIRRLVAERIEVVALQGARPPGGELPGVSWRRLDLLAAGEEETARFIEAERVTTCLHAAWYTNHADYLIADVNRDWLEASLRLAAAFRAGGGSRFIGLGTCLEYDQAWKGDAFSEVRTPLRPDTLYAQCKAELFRRLSEAGGDFVWARLFFVYGPGDRAGRLIPHVLAKLDAGEPVSARFGGLARDYIHVDDLAGQLARIAASVVQGAINTGTGTAEKLADIVRMASEAAGRPQLVEANDGVDPGQRRLVEADMKHFRDAIGDPATRPLGQGLAELIGRSS